MNLLNKYYNTKWALAPYLPLGFPPHLDIELSGKCQLACTMCPYGTGDFNEEMQGMMSRETAIAAIAEGIEGGAKLIKFNFRGEPGLSPLLIDMVKFAKDYGAVETMINTNLTSFSYRRLAKLYEAGLDLMIISIDGARKETYEKIRVKGDFDQLMKNLYYANAMNFPKIRLQFVEQEANKHETEMFKTKFEEYSDEIVIQKVRDRGAGEGQEATRVRCPQPWQRLVVAWDGKVFACCGNWNNEYPVGQFPNQSLKEIWNGDRLKALRKQATNYEGFPCKDCTVGSSYK